MRLADVELSDFSSWLHDPVTISLVETIKAEYRDLLRASAMMVAKNEIENARVCAGRIAEIEDLLGMLRVPAANQIPDQYMVIDDMETEVGEAIDPALEK